jgi:hypothetical protein
MGRFRRLSEKEAAVHRLCDVAQTPATIAKNLPEHEEATNELVRRRLLLPLDGKLLSLGVMPG